MTQTKQSKVISPGATIGVLGSGQLGRMMAIAAKHMGYRVRIFSASPDSPAGQVADAEVVGELEDLDAVERFAEQVDVITIETENIPTACLDVTSKHVPSFPGNRTLEVSQNRGLEKQFLSDNGIPTAKFKIVSSLEGLRDACNEIMPAVLKTTTGGYDGKGQFVIRSIADVEEAWEALKTDEAILEEWIEYDFEFSVLGARNSAGEVTIYPTIRNEHRNGILDVSISPSGMAAEIEAKAAELTSRIVEELGTVGVLAIEYFYRNGEILANEMAPRPHNSGHLTIEGHLTDQFEQHIRCVCGLPLGDARQLRPVAMANLLGDEWQAGEPRWDAALTQPETKLHLYGKASPNLNRKMGHMTTYADSPDEAREQVLAARKLLVPVQADKCDSNLQAQS